MIYLHIEFVQKPWLADKAHLSHDNFQHFRDTFFYKVEKLWQFTIRQVFFYLSIK